MTVKICVNVVFLAVFIYEKHSFGLTCKAWGTFFFAEKLRLVFWYLCVLCVVVSRELCLF